MPIMTAVKCCPVCGGRCVYDDGFVIVCDECEAVSVKE